VCYEDFKCSNVPVQGPSSRKTKILMKQIPNSFMVFCPGSDVFDGQENAESGELFKVVS
jgi:hypothetical protein